MKGLEDISLFGLAFFVVERKRLGVQGFSFFFSVGERAKLSGVFGGTEKGAEQSVRTDLGPVR